MKIVTVLGARPQFVKSAPLSRALRREHREILVHTGQHYDREMSDLFFSELGIPLPEYHLGAGSGSHGKQTGEMLEKIEAVLTREDPDLVLIYGDTNSTLAGALAAAKLAIPIAHVEAGLRSHDRSMPEEINRIVADHLSGLRFCPTRTAVRNLEQEGITKGVHLVGDVMADALADSRAVAEERSEILTRLPLVRGDYLVLTIHRPSNTDTRGPLERILAAVGESGRVTVFPVHPRTRKCLRRYRLRLPPNVLATEPLGYLDMIVLMAHAGKILTDSGGMQKEASMLGVPCITLRETTEWPETLEGGWNLLAGSDREAILAMIGAPRPLKTGRTSCFLPGASESILQILRQCNTLPE